MRKVKTQTDPPPIQARRLRGELIVGERDLSARYFPMVSSFSKGRNLHNQDGNSGH
jgi:hypothetical protein